MTISRFRRYSELIGSEVTIEVTPLPDFIDEYGKTGARIRVKQGRTVLWAPDDPLVLGAGYDVFTRRGRIEAANAALDFFEHALRERAYDERQ